MKVDKWTNRFMTRAEEVAQWSKDPKHKVGAIIVDSFNHVISEGYNGPPRLVRDKDLSDSERQLRSLHAEMNAILHAQGRNLCGATLYTWPYIPCATCAAMMIQVGITTVHYYDSRLTSWNLSQIEACLMFEEAKVKRETYTV